ncbi:MAG: V-type ATPase 116kDa subunit family protein [Candidatus Omnitrophota bacterium]|jgi:V/A-type H+-transporting ATPase subunit I
MFTTSSMELLNMVASKESIEKVASRLVELGIFQPVDIQKIEKELQAISPFGIDKENAQVQAFEVKLKEISRKLNLQIVPSREIKDLSSEEIKEIFKNIDEKLSGIISQKEESQIKLKTAESTFSQIEDYFIFPIKHNAQYSFLYVNLGELEPKSVPALEHSLKEITHLIYPLKIQKNKVSVLIIGLKKDRAYFEKTLRDLAWANIQLPDEVGGLSKDVEARLKKEMDTYEAEIVKFNLQINEVANSSVSDLSKISALISLKKSLIEAKKYSYVTDRTAMLSGWVLSEEKEKAVSEIKKIPGVYYVKGDRVEELNIFKEDIPVRLKNNAIFKPFELLINSYGIPRYGSIDPTIFVAITFLFMFGAMFGDLGQGLCLALTGLLLRKSKSVTVKQAAALLIYCGLSAAMFGIFYGTLFGFEEIIKPLLVRPMEDINEVFGASILFGIGVITLGVILNTINAFRDKDYIKAILDKTGLITGIIYWLAIAYVTKLFAAKTNISPIYLIVIAAGLFLVFLKPIIETISGHKKEKEAFFVTFMEGMVDILEIAMGYLANTVSFIRIAAFALAHAGLFLAIFELSHALKSMAGGSLSILIIILGNILVVLLEGMIVSIQSLRLNYYEFFSKFFLMGKQAYKPLTIEGQ